MLVLLEFLQPVFCNLCWFSSNSCSLCVTSCCDPCRSSSDSQTRICKSCSCLSRSRLAGLLLRHVTGQWALELVILALSSYSIVRLTFVNCLLGFLRTPRTLPSMHWLCLSTAVKASLVEAFVWHILQGSMFMK